MEAIYLFYLYSIVAIFLQITHPLYLVKNILARVLGGGNEPPFAFTFQRLFYKKPKGDIDTGIKSMVESMLMTHLYILSNVCALILN